MLETIAVGTDGSATATKAVEFALDLAQHYNAQVVFISSYRPVSESRLRQEQKDAPQELQWALNPAEDVEACKAMGVAEVFGPGSSTQETVEFLRREIPRRRARVTTQ